VQLIQQKDWQVHQRHNVARLRDQGRASDNKAAQQQRAKPELRRKAALLPRHKGQHVRQASDRVSRSRRPVVRPQALLASRVSNNVRKRMAPSPEFKAKELSRRKRNSLCRERGRGLQDSLVAREEVSEFNREKRSGLG
jgi:hypothetical protein